MCTLREHHRLAGGDSDLCLIKAQSQTSGSTSTGCLVAWPAGHCDHGRGLWLLAVADSGLDAISDAKRAILGHEPVEGSCAQLTAFGRRWSYDKRIGLDVAFSHIQNGSVCSWQFVAGSSIDRKSVALAKSVQGGAIVAADHLALGIYYHAWFGAKLAPKPAAHIDLAQKANSLAVFFGRRGQAALLRYYSDLVFGQMADWEEDALEAFTWDFPEEIGLILLVIVPAME